MYISRRPSTNQLTLDVVRCLSSMFDIQKQQNKQKTTTHTLETRAKVFYLKTTSYWISLLKKERKQYRTHVDHNQLDPLPYKIIYTNIVFFLKPLSACVIIKASTILLYMILNGKGSNWMWSVVFSGSIQYNLLFFKSILLM